jgi:4-hydroxybenzoate polyprenyltransferase
MPPKQYTEEDVIKAVYDVVEEGLSVNKASAKYSVPTSTLSDRVSGKHASKHDPEANPTNSLLSDVQERHIVAWILRQERLGFPPSQSAVREIVSSLANSKVGGH